MKKLSKPYWEMTTAELRKATRLFDKPIHRTQPLDPKMKSEWQLAKSRRGRPAIGDGAAKIRISMERELLNRADAFARKTGVSRSQLIARGVRIALSAGGQKP